MKRSLRRERCNALQDGIAMRKALLHGAAAVSQTKLAPVMPVSSQLAMVSLGVAALLEQQHREEQVRPDIKGLGRLLVKLLGLWPKRKGGPPISR